MRQATAASVVIFLQESDYGVAVENYLQNRFLSLSGCFYYLKGQQICQNCGQKLAFVIISDNFTLAFPQKFLEPET